MAIDFKKKLSSRTIAPKTDPVELYGTLDRKSVAGPLRPAQEAVLSEWYTKWRTGFNHKVTYWRRENFSRVTTAPILTQFKGGPLSLYLPEQISSQTGVC